MSTLHSPLAGITVLDFSELLPGPLFTQSLAELGAQVIKIERPPHGDNARRMSPGLFAAVNRGKRSLLVDLKDEAQRAEVRELIASADVLVESYRPGVMARFGLDHAALCASCPRLIYVSLSGYGQSGPYADLPGHDINYLAVAGALAVSGSVHGGPEQSFGLPVADLSGAMYGLSSTLAALYQRQSTGRGQYLDVALADCSLHLMNLRLGVYAETGLQSLAEQRKTTLVKVAYGAFRCRDGNYLSVAALEDHFWQRLTAALDMRPFDGTAYRSYASRKSEAEQINATLARVLGQMDTDVAFQLLVRNDIPAAPVVAPTQVASHPQFIARNMIDSSTGTALARYPVTMQGLGGGSGASPELDEYRR